MPACLRSGHVWGPRKSCGKTEEPRSANFASRFSGVTQTVKNRRKHSEKSPVKQGLEEFVAEPNKIGAGTTFDFEAKNLTAYGGLLPVATMLEKLGFQQLVEETLAVKRATRVMPMYQFVLALVLAILRVPSQSALFRN